MIEAHDSLIVKKATKFLVPFIQVFALYVLFHGHHSPGGGFQAGVLIGASIILQILVESRAEIRKSSLKMEFLAAASGLGVYAGVGLLALTGGNFLDYGKIALFAPEIPMRRFWGILGVEIGVTIVVAMTLVTIFHVLALGGEKEEIAS